MATPSRAAALSALNDFLPLVPRYASNRGFVRPGHPDVSRLSPFIRRRLISEQQVVETVLASHSFEAAEKFIQEVVWRTYWKGWLEKNPWVWDECLKQDAVLRGDQLGAPWGENFARACRGETQLHFFNDWISELQETGFLHNHVRMWFASVWVFTLKIPWELGAMLMYRHLLDGDPASNTLSWRWVTGLQTKGKSYLVKADNIHHYSEGRWRPAPGELAESVWGIEGDRGVGPRLSRTHEWIAALPSRCGVLVTSEDLSPECESPLVEGAQGAALWRYTGGFGESEKVLQFIEGAERDWLGRLGGRVESVASIDVVTTWVRASGFSHLVIVYPPVGPLTQAIDEIVRVLSKEGIICSKYRRTWDAELHPLSTKGFFPFWEGVKKRIRAGDPLFHGKRGVR